MRGTKINERDKSEVDAGGRDEGLSRGMMGKREERKRGIAE